MNCPHDGTDLQQSMVLGAKLRWCRKCGGGWMGAEDVSKLFAAMGIADLPAAGAQPRDSTAHLRCPQDRARMVALTHQGVVLDACPTCGGVWTDSGEFRRLAQGRVDEPAPVEDQIFRPTHKPANPASCPKCGYARKATDVAPEWQFPNCSITYAKYKSGIVGSLKRLVGIKTAKPQGYVPNHISVLERTVYIVLSLLLVGYSLHGLITDDLFIPSRQGPGQYVYGPPVFAFVIAAIFGAAALVSVVVDHYDKRNNEREYKKFASFAEAAGYAILFAGIIWSLTTGHVEREPGTGPHREAQGMRSGTEGLAEALLKDHVVVPEALASRLQRRFRSEGGEGFFEMYTPREGASPETVYVQVKMDKSGAMEAKVFNLEAKNE